MTERCESSIDASVPPLFPVRIRVPDARDQIAELNAALAARDSFLAFVGNELRHAMAPLPLLADQLAALAEDAHALPVIVPHATVLARNMRQLIATAHWVAELGDLWRGTLRLQPTPAELTEIIHDACRELAGEAAACGAELAIEPGAAVTGSWDRARLQRLVTGLVSSAIHHAGGRIELRVIDRGDAAELVVRDHGPGLDPAILPRLFDPSHPERCRASSGFGVELWIVKALTSALHGSVTANNCPDGGARFCVVVPRVME